MNRILVAGLCAAAAACSGSKSSPTSPESPPRVLQGQAVSAIDGSATGQVSVQIGGRFAIQSDADGNFQVDVGGPGTFAAVLSGSRVVERRANLTGPTADRTKVPLIPSSFDLPAFDEMFRGSNRAPQALDGAAGSRHRRHGHEVQRERHRPVRSAQRTADRDEVTALTNHLNEALALLTGGTFTSFASVKVEWPAAGEQVGVQRNGTIVVGRYTGIQDQAQTIGYGSWAEQPDGTVVGGSMWLDRDFDRDDAERRLVRIHELGHALGYSHVTVRTSIMNPSLGPSPTDFDRAAALIAFQRPVGNTSPDTDPGAGAGGFAVAERPVEVEHAGPLTARLRLPVGRNLPHESKQPAIVLVMDRHAHDEAAALIDRSLHRLGQATGIAGSQALDAACLRHPDRVDRAEVHPIRFELASFLRQLDQRVAAVLEHDRDEGRADAFGGLELLRVHRKPAVADRREHRHLRPRQLRADRGAQAVRHGGQPVRHPERLGMPARPELAEQVFVRPDIGRDNRFGRQHGRERANDVARPHRVRRAGLAVEQRATLLLKRRETGASHVARRRFGDESFEQLLVVDEGLARRHDAGRVRSLRESR